MSNLGKVVGGFILIIILLITALYIYISSGEKLASENISWLTKHPIAHRGLHNEIYPENSMGSFENAIENGYPIELDIRFTKDKKIVVFHDENLERVTGDNRDVSDVNYEEISKLRLLESDEGIPIFEDVLKKIDGKVPLIIEIKDCKDVLELGKESYNITKDYEGDYAVQSFNPYVLKWYRDNASEVVRGQLSGTMNDGADNLKSYEKFALRNLMLNFKSKPNYIAYEYTGLPKLRITMLRKQGIPIIGWTIRNEEEAKESYKYCDNIIMENFKVN